MTRLIVRPATSTADLDAVRRLCWDYRADLMAQSENERAVVETVYPEPVYHDLMQRLAQVHAPPNGGIALAETGGLPIGCGMWHELDAGVAEIKRVFVATSARGLGAGRALCGYLIAEIRLAGYVKAVLDTSISLAGARRLYEGLGFTACAPFRDVPPAARQLFCYYEKTL